MSRCVMRDTVRNPSVRPWVNIYHCLLFSLTKLNNNNQKPTIFSQVCLFDADPFVIGSLTGNIGRVYVFTRVTTRKVDRTRAQG